MANACFTLSFYKTHALCSKRPSRHNTCCHRSRCLQSHLARRWWMTLQGKILLHLVGWKSEERFAGRNGSAHTEADQFLDPGSPAVLQLVVGNLCHARATNIDPVAWAFRPNQEVLEQHCSCCVRWTCCTGKRTRLKWVCDPGLFLG